MSNFVLKIFDDEGELCSFYTVRNLEDDVSETEHFFAKFYKTEHLKTDAQELATLIQKEIGNKYGAKEEFFRHERQAQALPPKPGLQKITIMPNFPLRLYCLQLSDSCVVLFNGNEKTSTTSQSGKTSMAFYEANEFAKRILKAIQDKIIKFDFDQKAILDFYETEKLSEIIL